MTMPVMPGGLVFRPRHKLFPPASVYYVERLETLFDEQGSDDPARLYEVLGDLHELPRAWSEVFPGEARRLWPELKVRMAVICPDHWFGQVNHRQVSAVLQAYVRQTGIPVSLALHLRQRHNLRGGGFLNMGWYQPFVTGEASDVTLEIELYTMDAFYNMHYGIDDPSMWSEILAAYPVSLSRPGFMGDTRFLTEKGQVLYHEGDGQHYFTQLTVATRMDGVLERHDIPVLSTRAR